MSQYTIKNAILDLGFVDGYCRLLELPDDDIMFECILECLGRIESYIVDGSLLSGLSQDAEATATFLHDLGFIRGWLWTKPIPNAISEAFSRIINFATGDDFASYLTWNATTAEPKADRLSDDQRDKILTAGENGEDCSSAEYASSIGASHRGVLDQWNRLGVMTQEEIEEELQADTDQPIGAAAANEASPTATAPEAVAESSSEQPDPTGDEDPLAAIHELSETMSDDEIAERLGISRSTVLRYRATHGIEKAKGPREGNTRWEYQWEPWQKQKLIEMKLAGCSYGEISEAIGKTCSQCSGMWFWEKKKLDQAGVPVEKTQEPFALQTESATTEPQAESAFNPFNPSGKRGRRAWTPEQRAAQAERARETIRNRPPLVPDSELEAVKANFENGISFDKIGSKYGCSGSHIRNFLTKHGIDPRRRSPGVRHGGRPEFTEEQIQLIIDEKAKGTPSKEIGEMIDRSQHVIDVKYGQMKEGRVPEEHLAPEALAIRRQRQNEVVSEKMKEYHAGKRAEPEAETPSDELAITVERPAARWNPSPLSLDDWPDIQQMLASGRSLEAIASDFDVPEEDLNRFIDERLKARRSRGEPPGESLPSSPGMAGTAA